MIEYFEGKEVYRGLGSGFGLCGKRFLRQNCITEELGECKWTKDIKLDVLGRCLIGKAGQHFTANRIPGTLKIHKLGMQLIGGT